MPTSIFSFRLALGIAIVVAAGSRPAAAQDISLGGGTFVTELVEVVDQSEPAEGDNVEPFNQIERNEFFGVASCACDRLFGIRAQITGANAGDVSDRVTRIEAGINCDLIDEDQRECREVGAIPELSDLVRRDTFPLTIFELLDPDDPASETCLLPDEQERLIYFLVNDDQGNPATFGVDEQNPRAVAVDLAPPPAPTGLSAEPGEGAITVSWDASDNSDLDGYQVLCRRLAGNTQETLDEDRFPRDDEGFQTVATLIADEQCPNNGSRGDPIVDEIDRSSGDGDGDGDDAPDPGTVLNSDPTRERPEPEPEPEPAPFEDFYVCSDRLAPSSSGTRIDGLADGVEYEIAVAAIDEAFNIAVAFVPEPVAPRPVIDFWEEYQRSGGSADGGFCFVATATFGNYDHPFVRILRDFRDDTLAKFGLGRAFIRWYYDNSPDLAGFIARHDALRVVAGVLLAPLVGFAAVWEYTTALGKLGLLLAFLLLRHLRRRRRAHRLAAAAEAPAETVPGRRHRPRGRKLAAVVAAAVVLLAWSAAADAQPYWDEPGGPAEVQSRMPKKRSVARWNFELKFGPWTPNIDGEFNSGLSVTNYVEDEGGTLTVGDPLQFDGPYDAVFGGAGLLTQLQLDRYLLQNRYGDFGVGLSVGYLRKSGDALLIDELEEDIASVFGNGVNEPFARDGRLARSEGDSISFNLMPLATTAVFRFTYLDTQIGVPLVPYVRGGLSYYLWWTRNPAGDTAEATDTDSGETVRGSGGSLGFQATVGLALRLERIDVEAGTNLRDELGIEHASFFFEGTLAEVDGFGDDSRLSVGDVNWAAGMSFEF